MGQAVAAASAASSTARSLQVWRALVGCVAIFLEFLLQMLRGTPSLLSFVGLRSARGQKFLSSSSSATAAIGGSSSAEYAPLAVEPLTDTFTPPPPSARANDGVPKPIDKLTIVLDLDETLICSYETSSLPSIVRNQAIKAGIKCFDVQFLSAEKDAEGRQRVNHVTVFERPNLREFLKQISELGELVLFTAGLEDYAKPVIDTIDIDNKLIRRLYRAATVSTEYREHVKDLSRLSNDPRRIVIVDNNPFSFLLQPLNGIPCIPFSAGQHCDEQLMGVILPLLKHLSLQKDVRPVLHQVFHMPEWFNQHGIPSLGSLNSTKKIWEGRY